MSSETVSPPDGAQDVVEQAENDDELQLAPGEEVVARLVTSQPVETEYGESAILTLETEDRGMVDYFAKGDAKRAVNQGGLDRGATYWIAKENTTEEVNGTEYNPTRIKKIED